MSESKNSCPSTWASYSPRIGIAALYEDLEAGLRAKALVERIRHDLDLSTQLKLGVWRFDWLKERSLWSMALSAAQGSSLVVISTSSDRPFPVEMEVWINAWAQSREEHPAHLVALLSRKKNRSPRLHPVQQALQSVAQQKGVQLLCEFFKQPAATRSWWGNVGDFQLHRSLARRAIMAPIPSSGRVALTT